MAKDKDYKSLPHNGKRQAINPSLVKRPKDVLRDHHEALNGIQLSFDARIETETIILVLEKLADYYRKCGGDGLLVEIPEQSKTPEQSI